MNMATNHQNMVIILALSLLSSYTPNHGALGLSWSEPRCCACGDEYILKLQTLQSSSHRRFDYFVPTLPLDAV